MNLREFAFISLLEGLKLYLKYIPLKYRNNDYELQCFKIYLMTKHQSFHALRLITLIFCKQTYI